MPVHDWTRVSDGTFHDFHHSWVLEIKRALMRGLLPKDYYARAEQFGGNVSAPDVLALQAPHAGPAPEETLAGTATLTESPLQADARTTVEWDSYARRQRTLIIRHSSSDRIVAMIEVLSRSNKSNRHAVRSLMDKVFAALDGGIHLLLVDVHLPGPHDPLGIYGLFLNEIGTEEYMLPVDWPLTVAAYSAGARVEVFAKHFSVGESIPEMPLFLTREHYVRAPLEATYRAAWQEVPPQYQEALGGST
jgi:hypothetical protein